MISLGADRWMGAVMARKQKSYLACDWAGCDSEDATHFAVQVGEGEGLLTEKIDLCPAHQKEPLDVIIGRRRRGAASTRARIDEGRRLAKQKRAGT